MKTDSREQLLADVDAYCRELRPIEELCYVEHRYNDQTVELAKKYNLLGMPVPVEYGGRGADAVSLCPGPGSHRPRGHRRAHLLLRPDVDRPIPDHALRQRRAAQAIPARVVPGRKDPGLRPDRARRRLEPAGDDHHLSPRGRQVSAQRRQVSDLQRRHRRRGGLLRLSRGPHGRRAAHERVHRRHRGRDVRGRRPARQARHVHRQHRHVSNDRPSGAGGKPAGRGGRRLSHRDGHACLGPVERGRRAAWA